MQYFHPLSLASLAFCLLTTATAQAELPPPPKDMAPWPMAYGADVPGLVSADSLLPKPAGKLGPVVVRDGHFYTGNQRLRFWGANICFSGAFPTHEQADAVARRLARFGINAIRFHHMDNQPFPNGIFTDGTLEKLSPEALDRLDYFIAALKREGIYSNINLHVSRHWSRTHKWENSDKLDTYDKMLDLFHPELIAPQKKYARDLLTHVNAYTKTRYIDEPAIAIVEINNEDGLFIWGGEQKLRDMPEPYATLLGKLWNQWLLEKYGSTQKLQQAWNAGAQPAGANIIKDTQFATLGGPNSRWAIERHNNAQMTVTREPAGGVKLQIPAGVEPSWHLQFNQSQLSFTKGKTYSVRFRARANQPLSVPLVMAQAHDPWGNLGFSAEAKLTTTDKEFWFGFTAAETDANARLSFTLGRQAATIWISDIQVFEGGTTGLSPDEDPAKGTVQRDVSGRPQTAARQQDWFAFVQATDQKFFVEMQRFLKEEIGVKCPITGTIGFGPLGTQGQAQMDFVDQHSYWEHPHFPRRQWDMRDWVIDNKPMTDNPAGATFWNLAATRVLGKPFTVTEYNHSAPNEWQAECVPMIAAYAALQDWDGIFLFSYTHNTHYQRDRTDSFFDLEGNPLKMAFMPLAARLFLGQGVTPLDATTTVPMKQADMLATASKYWNHNWNFVQDIGGITWERALASRLVITYDPTASASQSAMPTTDRVAWTSKGRNTGTGQFVLRDPRAVVFAGFAGASTPIDLGPVRIESLQSPFAVLMLIPADPSQTIESADRLLLAVVGRGGNVGTQWDAQRRSISDQWGAAPQVVEVVKATLSIRSAQAFKVSALTPAGTPLSTLPTQTANGTIKVELGGVPAVWYELRREK